VQRIVAAEPGVRFTGYVDADTPVPTSHPDSTRARGVGSRCSQPNRREPSRRHATRLRLENGLPDSGSTSGSLRTRNSTGSTPQASASSSTATSGPNMPGHSPGARIHDGTGTSNAASRWVVRRFGAAYIVRLGTAVCSANSLIREVWETASIATAASLPSASHPSRTRWIVGVR
jgi:hypothetical protein